MTHKLFNLHPCSLLIVTAREIKTLAASPTQHAWFWSSGGAAACAVRSAPTAPSARGRRDDEPAGEARAERTTQPTSRVRRVPGPASPCCRQPVGAPGARVEATAPFFSCCVPRHPNKVAGHGQMPIFGLAASGTYPNTPRVLLLASLLYFVYLVAQSGTYC